MALAYTECPTTHAIPDLPGSSFTSSFAHLNRCLGDIASSPSGLIPTCQRLVSALATSLGTPALAGHGGGACSVYLVRDKEAELIASACTEVIPAYEATVMSKRKAGPVSTSHDILSSLSNASPSVSATPFMQKPQPLTPPYCISSPFSILTQSDTSPNAPTISLQGSCPFTPRLDADPSITHWHPVKAACRYSLPITSLPALTSVQPNINDDLEREENAQSETPMKPSTNHTPGRLNTTTPKKNASACRSSATPTTSATPSTPSQIPLESNTGFQSTSSLTNRSIDWTLWSYIAIPITLPSSFLSSPSPLSTTSPSSPCHESTNSRVVIFLARPLPPLVRRADEFTELFTQSLIAIATHANNNQSVPLTSSPTTSSVSSSSSSPLPSTSSPAARVPLLDALSTPLQLTQKISQDHTKLAIDAIINDQGNMINLVSPNRNDDSESSIMRSTHINSEHIIIATNTSSFCPASISSSPTTTSPLPLLRRLCPYWLHDTFISVLGLITSHHKQSSSADSSASSTILPPIPSPPSPRYRTLSHITSRTHQSIVELLTSNASRLHHQISQSYFQRALSQFNSLPLSSTITQTPPLLSDYNIPLTFRIIPVSPFNSPRSLKDPYPTLSTHLSTPDSMAPLDPRVIELIENKATQWCSVLAFEEVVTHEDESPTSEENEAAKSKLLQPLMWQSRIEGNRMNLAKGGKNRNIRVIRKHLLYPIFHPQREDVISDNELAGDMNEICSEAELVCHSKHSECTDDLRISNLVAFLYVSVDIPKQFQTSPYFAQDDTDRHSITNTSSNLTTLDNQTTNIKHPISIDSLIPNAPHVPVPLHLPSQMSMPPPPSSFTSHGSTLQGVDTLSPMTPTRQTAHSMISPSNIPTPSTPRTQRYVAPSLAPEAIVSPSSGSASSSSFSGSQTPSRLNSGGLSRFPSRLGSRVGSRNPSRAPSPLSTPKLSSSTLRGLGHYSFDLGGKDTARVNQGGDPNAFKLTLPSYAEEDEEQVVTMVYRNIPTTTTTTPSIANSAQGGDIVPSSTSISDTLNKHPITHSMLNSNNPLLSAHHPTHIVKSFTMTLSSMSPSSSTSTALSTPLTTTLPSDTLSCSSSSSTSSSKPTTLIISTPIAWSSSELSLVSVTCQEIVKHLAQCIAACVVVRGKSHISKCTTIKEGVDRLITTWMLKNRRDTHISSPDVILGSSSSSSSCTSSTLSSSSTTSSAPYPTSTAGSFNCLSTSFPTPPSPSLSLRSPCLRAISLKNVIEYGRDDPSSVLSQIKRKIRWGTVYIDDNDIHGGHGDEEGDGEGVGLSSCSTDMITYQNTQHRLGYYIPPRLMKQCLQYSIVQRTYRLILLLQTIDEAMSRLTNHRANIWWVIEGRRPIKENHDTGDSKNNLKEELNEATSTGLWGVRVARKVTTTNLKLSIAPLIRSTHASQHHFIARNSNELISASSTFTLDATRRLNLNLSHDSVVELVKRVATKPSWPLTQEFTKEELETKVDDDINIKADEGVSEGDGGNLDEIIDDDSEPDNSTSRDGSFSNNSNFIVFMPQNKCHNQAFNQPLCLLEFLSVRSSAIVSASLPQSNAHLPTDTPSSNPIISPSTSKLFLDDLDQSALLQVAQAIQPLYSTLLYLKLILKEVAEDIALIERSHNCSDNSVCSGVPSETSKPSNGNESSNRNCVAMTLQLANELSDSRD